MFRTCVFILLFDAFGNNQGHAGFAMDIPLALYGHCTFVIETKHCFIRCRMVVHPIPAASALEKVRSIPVPCLLMIL